MSHLPLTIVVITVWCYWLSVGVMVIRSHLKFKTESGAVPRIGLERWLWLIWVPTVIGWLVLPRIGYSTSLLPFRVPQWVIDHPHALLDWFAAVAAVAAYLLTIPCWLTLGANWSLAIVPGKEAHLVTRGCYVANPPSHLFTGDSIDGCHNRRRTIGGNAHHRVCTSHARSSEIGQ